MPPDIAAYCILYASSREELASAKDSFFVDAYFCEVSEWVEFNAPLDTI